MTKIISGILALILFLCHGQEGIAKSPAIRYTKPAALYSLRQQYEKANELAHNNSSECLKLYDEIIRKDPDDWVARTAAGEFLSQQNRYPEAIRYLDQILAKGRVNTFALERRAYYHACQNNWRLALNDYSTLLKITPDDRQALKNRSLIYQRMGRMDLARKDLQAIEAAKNKATRFTENERSATAQALTNALKISPNTRLIYLKRAFRFRQNKDYKRAVEDFTRVIEMPKGKGGRRLEYNLDQLYYDRAMCYQNMGDFASAATDYSKILEMDPDAEEAFLYRGNCYAKLNNWQKAASDYTFSIKHDIEPTPTVYKYRAEAYKRLGKMDLAKKDLETAKRLSGASSN